MSAFTAASFRCHSQYPNNPYLSLTSFTENDITGPFPEEIFELKSMERLYISFNEITGTLPKAIGELADLTEFYAYTNEMTGELNDI